ncbi:MAG: hypothetical protein GY822_31575 [Deltaproteobacteria bacterium]|nr:hypothetical protein [Deltaproteobacteria bacterium]
MSIAPKKLLLAAVTVCALSSVGCTALYTNMLYTNITGPMQAMEKKIGPKRGKACAKSYLNLVAIGDGGIAAAAKQGGIREVTSVDFSHMSILGLYQERCAIVTGI